MRDVTHLGSPPNSLDLVRLGDTFFTSGVDATDPRSGDRSAADSAQVDAVFANLGALLAAASISPDSVGFVTIGLSLDVDVELLADPWSTLFPDAATAPVAQVRRYALPAGRTITLQATGVDGEKRIVVGGPAAHGLSPRVVRIGDLVFTADVDGRTPGTGELSADREEQVRQAYANLHALLAEVGAGWDDVLHVFVYFRDRKGDQPLMHGIWQEIFPVHGLCPARKAINYSELAGTDTVLAFEAMAVVGSERCDYVLDNIRGHDTGTMAASVGPLFYSSGVSGDPPGERQPLGSIEEQTRWAFDHMRGLVEKAGGSLASIGQVSIMIRDYADVDTVLAGWRELFPDPADEPAHRFVGLELNAARSELLQLHVIAGRSR